MRAKQVFYLGFPKYLVSEWDCYSPYLVARSSPTFQRLAIGFWAALYVETSIV